MTERKARTHAEAAKAVIAARGEVWTQPLYRFPYRTCVQTSRCVLATIKHAGSGAGTEQILCLANGPQTEEALRAALDLPPATLVAVVEPERPAWHAGVASFANDNPPEVYGGPVAMVA